MDHLSYKLDIFSTLNQYGILTLSRIVSKDKFIFEETQSATSSTIALVFLQVQICIGGVD